MCFKVCKTIRVVAASNEPMFTLEENRAALSDTFGDLFVCNLNSKKKSAKAENCIRKIIKTFPVSPKIKIRITAIRCEGLEKILKKE